MIFIFALFENILTALRTNLFIETTNRIDISLGEQVIDHLLRLPLSYFDKRPVGELSSRLSELENIRSFLTGTALTVVLDVLFSIIYIAVMIMYSWVLSIVALLLAPILAILTYSLSPILRGQLRTKAELNAATQNHLVEVLTGIQTVKAQNFEVNARWRWKNRYSKYISKVLLMPLHPRRLIPSLNFKSSFLISLYFVLVHTLLSSEIFHWVNLSLFVLYLAM